MKNPESPETRAFGSPDRVQAERAVGSESLSLRPEELDPRLEAALWPFLEWDPLEPCVWFCGCFLVHGV